MRKHIHTYIYIRGKKNTLKHSRKHVHYKTSEPRYILLSPHRITSPVYIAVLYGCQFAQTLPQKVNWISSIKSNSFSLKYTKLIHKKKLLHSQKSEFCSRDSPSLSLICSCFRLSAENPWANNRTVPRAI